VIAEPIGKLNAQMNEVAHPLDVGSDGLPADTRARSSRSRCKLAGGEKGSVYWHPARQPARGWVARKTATLPAKMGKARGRMKGRVCRPVGRSCAA
jgi:hypothetical protein